MNIISRTITGICTIVLGMFLVVLSFMESFVIMIYGLPILILGFFILFNTKEDEIEEIKSNKVKGSKDKNEK